MPHAAVPVIVTFPAPVDEILAVEVRHTPVEKLPVPHEVPLTMTEPELAVTQELFTVIPRASLVPFAAVPATVTFPDPVDEILEDEVKHTPTALFVVPHANPLTVSVPPLDENVEPLAMTPLAKLVPFAAVPVIVTLPAPVAEMLAGLLKTP